MVEYNKQIDRIRKLLQVPENEIKTLKTTDSQMYVKSNIKDQYRLTQQIGTPPIDRCRSLDRQPLLYKEKKQLEGKLKYTSNEFIMLNYDVIVDIINKQQMSWSTQWQVCVQTFRNVINNYLYSLLKQSNGQSNQTLIHATSILDILENSHLKTITIKFCNKILQLIPKQQEGVISSITQLLQYINSDFSSLVFKIQYDVPYLIHLIPRDPQIIGFSDFKDTCIDGASSVKYSSLFSYKQLNWMVHSINSKMALYDKSPLQYTQTDSKDNKQTESKDNMQTESKDNMQTESEDISVYKQQNVQISQIDLGIIVSIAYFQNECIIYVPSQNTREAVCFTPEIALKNEQSDIFTIYNEIVQQLALKGYCLTNTIKDNNLDECRALDPQSTYCLYLSAQRLFTFPTKNNIYLLYKYNKDQEITYNHYLQTSYTLTEETLKYQDNRSFQSTKLNTEDIISFMRTYRTEHTIYNKTDDPIQQTPNKQIFPYQFMVNLQLQCTKLLNNQQHIMINTSTQNNNNKSQIDTCQCLKRLNTKDSQQNKCNGIVERYIITTQFMLFVNNYADHMKQLKKQDTLYYMKDILTLYREQPRQVPNQREIQKYQKLKYPLSDMFIQQLTDILMVQQLRFIQQKELVIKALSGANKQQLISIIEYIQTMFQSRKITTYDIVPYMVNLNTCKKQQLLDITVQLTHISNVDFDINILNNIVNRLRKLNNH